MPGWGKVGLNEAMAVESDARKCDDSGAIRPRVAWAVIVLASALAHLGCLGSQFYLDDATILWNNPQILESEWIGGPLLAWTRFWQVAQFRLFGMSPVGFHAVNWLLHTAVACVCFGFGRDLLKGRAGEGVACFAALLFAVHPLGSEIPNYARTQDLAWVTLFSLLASWSLLSLIRGGGWTRLAGFLLAMAGATMSKGPGIFHASMMAGVVAWVSMTPDHWRAAKRWLAPALGVGLVGLGVLWFAGILPRWIDYADTTWEGPRFISHAYTLARVYWEFAWRSVLPIGLCSDHQIAETVVNPGDGWWGIADRTARFAAAGMLGMAAVGLGLALKGKTRIFGACLFLFTATILFRVMYVVPEFMPEYRIYPGMPWFCLGAAILLDALWRRVPGGGSPRLWAGLLLLPCIVLSAKRSFVWHDLDRLCADVLRQYPAQGRAVWELHDRDLARKDWSAIIARQQSLWPGVFRSFIDQSKELHPARNLNSGHFALADVACQCRLAIALAHAQGVPAGLAELRRLEARMRQLGIREDSNRTIWGYFHHARATLMEMAGSYPQALESMRFEGVFGITPEDIRRVEEKLAKGGP